MSETKLLTETEVASEYGLNVHWLRRKRLERKGPRFVRVGRMVRYHRDDLEQFIQNATVQTRAT